MFIFFQIKMDTDGLQSLEQVRAGFILGFSTSLFI